MSKVLERIIHNKITVCLETRQLFDSYPSGYRKGHSTQSVQIKLSDDIRAGIDHKHVTMLLLFDFSKAFDIVCHVTLLRQLGAAGFSRSALKWITSYLTGREQAVIDDDGTPSTFARLNRGVPQGSVLGPLLVLLLINGIGNGFNDVFYLIYADDLQLYVTFPLRELQRYVYLAEDNANIILNWATANQLSTSLKPKPL